MNLLRKFIRQDPKRGKPSDRLSSFDQMPKISWSSLVGNKISNVSFGVLVKVNFFFQGHFFHSTLKKGDVDIFGWNFRLSMNVVNDNFLSSYVSANNNRCPPYFISKMSLSSGTMHLRSHDDC